MLILFANDYHLHLPKYEFYDGKKIHHAEQPDRIARILLACKSLGLRIKEVDHPVDRDIVTQLHDPYYIEYFRDKCAEIRNEDQLMPSVFIKDTYTPITRHTYEAALMSAQLAMTGADMLMSKKEQQVYALCRPPGHHAERNAMAGYCYINNAALATMKLATGGKVAVLDIDYHHGNGTQKFFYERDDILYVSIHAEPQHAFPYSSGYEGEKGHAKGLGFNHNIPLPPETTPTIYLKALLRGIDIINKFHPDYLVISLGYDTFESDPIGGLGITESTFEQIGTTIRENLKIPTLIVQEGGYNISKLDKLAKNFLTGYLDTHK